MPRGGKRQGQPGVAYGNRTDLNGPQRLPEQAYTGQPYGTATQQIQSQQALPMGSSPTQPTVAPTPPNIPSAIPLSSPSARPNEPVQAGLSSGPGPGPSVAPASAPDPVEAQLRGLYMRYPNRDLASLIEMLDKGIPS